MSPLACLDLDDVIRQLAPYAVGAALLLGAGLLFMGGTTWALARVFGRFS